VDRRTAREERAARGQHGARCAQVQQRPAGFSLADDLALARHRLLGVGSSARKTPSASADETTPNSIIRRPSDTNSGDGIEALALDGEGLGRSRGGLSTKIHLAVDGRGLLMRFLLNPGQAGDKPQLVPLLDGISVARIGPGRPRCRPGR
jgi:hypothetical protein